MEGMKRAHLIDPFESVLQKEPEKRDFDKAPGAPLRPKTQNRHFGSQNAQNPARSLTEIQTNRLNSNFSNFNPSSSANQFTNGLYGSNANNNLPEFQNIQQIQPPQFDQAEILKQQQHFKLLQLQFQAEQLQQLKLEQMARINGRFLGQNSSRMAQNSIFSQNIPNLMQNSYQPYTGITEQRKPQPFNFINPKIPMHIPYQVSNYRKNRTEEQTLLQYALSDCQEQFNHLKKELDIRHPCERDNLKTEELCHIFEKEVLPILQIKSQFFNDPELDRKIRQVIKLCKDARDQEKQFQSKVTTEKVASALRAMGECIRKCRTLLWCSQSRIQSSEI